ncbi:MAG: hypothetical protein HUU35_12415, partial [Armatimonadetes bacterium]|nr:hypothetical protein [Armatimonadota bacterium]
EAETLALVGTRPGGVVAEVQEMAGFRGGRWSGDAQRFIHPGRPVELDFALHLHSGEYELELLHTRAIDYGRFQVLLNGRVVGPEVDGFHPTVVSASAALGRVAVVGGEQMVTIKIVGRQPASTGHFVGLDALVFRPAGKQD